MRPSLSAVLITRDEAKNIRECLDSVKFCDELIVVDSGSADGTVDLARAAGAKVWTRPFSDGFAAQKNFAIEKASGEWVLLLDADERVPEALRQEILAVLERPKADGYILQRHNRIFGRWMRHGANAHDLQLRLAKTSAARFYGAVHERIRLDGKAETLKNPLRHLSTETISEYMKKLNAYTELEAGILLQGDTADPVRQMKQKPLLRLAQLLILKHAFMDGLEGILFATLSAYYEFVSLVKHWERSGKKAGAS